MSKKSAKHSFLTPDALRVILIILGSVFSTLVLTFSVLAITEIQQENLGIASGYLLGIFIVLGVSRLITFFKDRTRVSFLRFLILFVFNITLGVILIFAKNNPYLYSLVGGLYCLTVIVSRLFKIAQNHSLRSIILNSIIITLFVLLAIGLFIPYEGSISDVVLIVCTIVAISAFVEVFSNATMHLKLKVLFKIILRTFALEVILGLLTLMVAFSLIFMLYEPTIVTFGEGLWYSFAVVTTIGFGDFFATTPLTRILTVILGLYGVLVTAVITSIIVNFYNETAGKRDAQELKDIKNEEKIKE